MRKAVTWLILMTGAPLLLLAPGVSAQVVNPGFENWAGGNPDGWITMNIPGYYVPITQSTSSHSGTYAMQGSVVTYLSVAVPPLPSTLSPVSQRYAYLTGYYSFTPVGADTFGVAVTMYTQSIPMGAGIFLTGATVSSYTQFSVPLTYGSDQLPDTCRIQIFIANEGAVHVGSTFLVDDLSLSGTANSVEAERGIPAKYDLHQNYPNPFNPSTTISYDLPLRSHVSLAIFNTLGQQLLQLVNEEMETGHHELKFDAAGLSSGVYYCRLQARPIRDGQAPPKEGGQARDYATAKKLLLLR